VPRNHRKPGVIRFICTDAYHHDEPGYADRGHHHYGTLRPVYPDGVLAGVAWSGPRAEPRDSVATSGIMLAWPGVAPPLPQKSRRRDDGTAVWRFRCSCGRNPEPPEAELAAIAARHAEAFPGRRIEIDIVRLDRL
jgi:hypothetical protein